MSLHGIMCSHLIMIASPNTSLSNCPLTNVTSLHHITKTARLNHPCASGERPPSSRHLVRRALLGGYEMGIYEWNGRTAVVIPIPLLMPSTPIPAAFAVHLFVRQVLMAGDANQMHR